MSASESKDPEIEYLASFADFVRMNHGDLLGVVLPVIEQVAAHGPIQLLDIEMARSEVAGELEQQGDWRRRVAERHPDDDRNLRAAQHCERLAWEIRELDPDNPTLRILALVEAAIDLLPEDQQEGYFVNRNEQSHEFWRVIGFHEKYDSGELFLVAWIEFLVETLQGWLSEGEATRDPDADRF